MDNFIKDTFEKWLDLSVPEIKEELLSISDNTAEIEDRFYKELQFGTGGLRGIIGAGTNRMNIHTVAHAAQGLANYISKKFVKEQKIIAIAYDTRIKSYEFAKTAAEVFAANGIAVKIYAEPMPTPCLSFAVRELKCAAGVVITASHNPSEYNGYKVYGADGCQITTEAASDIAAEMCIIDYSNDIQKIDFNEGLQSESIEYIQKNVYTAFIEAVKGQSLADVSADKNIFVVYSPLNGTGLKPVLRVLKESGYTNITVVKEQEAPDGTFPTCPYPNPEIKEAMSLGIEYAKRNNADLFISTDPDCDRAGIAVKAEDGSYVLLSANETGILLLDYICQRRTKLGTMPKEPVFIKTIVTTDMAEKIAKNYGVRTINVLTGFKFIGEQIGFLENQKQENSYIFGFEESCGYLSGTYVRDKDAVNAALLICEMAAFYKQKGISLLQKLKTLYRQYGYFLNTQHSFEFEGSDGSDKMQSIMQRLRGGIKELGGRQVIDTADYINGIDGLPKSDVIKYTLNGNCSVIVRPSGTEPKLKAYVSVCAEDETNAKASEKKIISDLKLYFERELL